MFIKIINKFDMSVWYIITIILLFIIFISGIINIDYKYINILIALILILVYTCIE